MVLSIEPKSIVSFERKVMQLDESGRIRFTRDNVRFVVSKNGVRAYERFNGDGYDTEYAMNRDRTARAILRNLDEVSTAVVRVRRGQ